MFEVLIKSLLKDVEIRFDGESETIRVIRDKKEYVYSFKQIESAVNDGKLAEVIAKNGLG